jgi:AraC-like DNA-binding protein
MIIAYKEFRPSVALQPYVENYWLQVFDGDPSEESPHQVCLPLGMVQIIVHVNQPDCGVLQGNDWHPLPHALFAGVYNNAVTWKAKGYAVCFGINFKPESLTRLFRIPAAALFNDYTDVSNFQDAAIDEMVDHMYGVEETAQLIRIAETCLLEKLKKIHCRQQYWQQAAELIRQAKGNITIESLCKDLYISERQLQRSFRDTLGASPKTYTRIIRFRNAHRQVRHTTHKKISWASLSYDHGYADQAHFIRDFKEFSGVSPSLIVDQEGPFYQLSTDLFRK